ncbi:uncharacterized protein LOC119597135 [Penaeus monodon]|uniref:uncharacterized protein LOC119597135 n=1 Tax=Penaeus monodon TaxID=6687 RepID=UPI0018A7597A|nr:uncharacterized protein LOC119597135 [Penaeus monodon]
MDGRRKKNSPQAKRHKGRGKERVNEDENVNEEETENKSKDRYKKEEKGSSKVHYVGDEGKIRDQSEDEDDKEVETDNDDKYDNEKSDGLEGRNTRNTKQKQDDITKKTSERKEQEDKTKETRRGEETTQGDKTKKAYDKEQNQATKIRSRGRDWDSCDDDKEQNQATKIRSRGRDWDSCDDDKEQNQATKIRSRGRDWDEDEEVNHTDKKNAGRTTGDKENTEYKRGEKDVSHDPMEWDSCLQDDFEQALLKCDQMMEARRLDSLADRKKKQFDNASRPTSPPVREDSRWAPVSSKNRKPKQRESKATDDPVSAARSTYKGSEPATRSPRRRGDSEDAKGRRSSRETDADDPEFRPQDLVEFLGRQSGFQAPVDKMRDIFSWQVNRALANLPHIFCIKNDRMKLRPKVRVCSAYASRSGCIDRSLCFKIHICSGFIFGDCELENCNMGHSLRTNHNIKAIQAFYLGRLSDRQLCNFVKMNEVALRRETTQQHLDVCRDYNEETCNKSRINVWSHSPEGSPKIPEICYKSLSRTCTVTGCPRLHSKIPFHWQVTKDLNTWYNFPKEHVTFLEKHFCNPENNLTLLKQLDDSCHNGGLLSLLKHYIWEIGFTYMQWVNNCAYIPIFCQNMKYHIRRLCTERNPTQNLRENRFIWYFQDDLQKWCPFDHPNINKLEDAYEKNPKGNVTIWTNEAKYSVDFRKMNQKNLLTKRIRHITRRPTSFT